MEPTQVATLISPTFQTSLSPLRNGIPLFCNGLLSVFFSITVLACLGIYEKLDYIQDLGVDAIWVQPFYKSPMKDNGYDVADYTGVNPLLGTLDDVKKLINATHDRGIQLLLLNRKDIPTLTGKTS